MFWYRVKVSPAVIRTDRQDREHTGRVFKKLKAKILKFPGGFRKQRLFLDRPR